MVIYLDVLIILNMFVDYFLLLSCSLLLKINVKKKRLILGAVVGSLFSFFILFPDLNFFLNLIFNVAGGLFLVFITFGYKRKQLFLKTVSIFFAENIIFAGVMFFVWLFFSPPGMLWKNGVTYITISPYILIFGSLTAYILTSTINFFLSSRVDSKKIYLIEIEFNKKKICLNALYDSGNCLTEPFSKKPVCVCEYEKLVEIFPLELVKFFDDFFKNITDVKNFEWKKKIKLIPCDTISNSLVLPAFYPENFNVLFDDGNKKQFDCFVAVTTKKISDGEYNAIIGDFNWKEGFLCFFI